ncbi:MAG: endo III-related endonuclease [Bacteriovoracaceae bacterium]|nr:endo III-related endonuclease [Bacteriovoracaceae bacterium]
MRSPAEIQAIIKKLRELYPDAECSLDFKSPFQLLVATILSAQCTDERVNKVTPALFKKFPTAFEMSKAQLSDIEESIKSTGFYKNKAKSLKGTAEKLVSQYAGELPRTMEELFQLPGVGRKTANVVLGNAFQIAEGVVVDTHVKRVSFRLGLTKQTDPAKVEKELNQKIPKKYWICFPHWLIQHGRKICIARAPKCGLCELNSLCEKRGVAKKFTQTTAPIQNRKVLTYQALS